jgi:hypothetical protein
VLMLNVVSKAQGNTRAIRGERLLTSHANSHSLTSRWWPLGKTRRHAPGKIPHFRCTLCASCKAATPRAKLLLKRGAYFRHTMQDW